MRLDSRKHAATQQAAADSPPAAMRFHVNVPRVVALCAIVVILLAVGAGQAWAADWPPFKPDPAPKTNFRGPGFYFNWVKILAFWGIFLAWVKTTDWVSIDCQELKLDFLRWNPIVFGTFMLAILLVWFIPSLSFWIALPILLIAYIAPLTTYIVYRNSKVDNNQRVMTPEHLRYWSATYLNKLGMKVEAERPDPHEVGPPVKLQANTTAADVAAAVDQALAAANAAAAHDAHARQEIPSPEECTAQFVERTDNARLLTARQSPGMLVAREILAEGMVGRATSFMLDYTPQGVTVRTMIDGVWIPHEPRGRDVGDPALETLKLLCGLNPQDRQNRQSGSFGIEYESRRYVATFVSQGTPTGERALIQFEEGKIPRRSLDDLGMRVKLQDQLHEVLRSPQGLVLFSAPPGGGLRSTMDAVLHACDRFTREFAGLEEEGNPYQVVENIAMTTYSAASGQTTSDVLPKFFRTEPHVAVIRDLLDKATVEILLEQIPDGRLIISTIRAKDCAEALLRVLALGVSPSDFAKSVTGVVNQRLIRKLCDGCKEAYTPAPQVLQQLGIPEGRLQALYRPFQPNPQEPKEPCRTCGGIGYFGRTAIFEILTVGDAVRKVLASGPKLDALRQAARKDGMKSLQEEGVLMVARGVTSLPELMRVLKQ
jgi:type II secretory ATPase GspE/PulE/Tfp pilus assembly ATPase PilB-like protein